MNSLRILFSALESYDRPSNIRELFNSVNRAVSYWGTKKSVLYRLPGPA